MHMTKEKLLEVTTYLAKRLAEPSSHAALAAFFMNIGFATDEGTIQGVCFVLSGVFSAIGFLMKDSQKESEK